MAGAIGPGDFVECVDASPRRGQDSAQISALAQLSVGRLYCVSGLAARDSQLLIAGLRAAYEHEGWGWYAERFRPVLRPKASFIESLKQPAPARKAPPQPAPREREGV